MEEEKKVPVNPIAIDFADYYNSVKDSGEEFNAAIEAQAFSNVKKQDSKATLIFDDERFNQIKETSGQETAENIRKAYIETMEFSDISDKQDLFAPVALAGYQNDAKGIKNFSSLAKNELKIDPVFNQNSFYKPTQYRTFQEAAESNVNYMDEDGTVKKLKDSEDYGDITNPWLVGFGSNSLVVSTNEFVAESNPDVKAKIESGELNAKGYYKDESENYLYRKLRDGEENFDSVRSIFGPRTIYNSALLKESGQSFYDGILGLAEGAGTLSYYGNKLASVPLRLIGFKGYDEDVNKWFNSFTNMTARLKSSGSMEEDRGVLDNFTNFTKAVMNGIGQIVGTMGTGYAVGGAMKGIGALSQTNKISQLSTLYAADFASATTRGLNFGIAAKAGKEESMRRGLSKDESDIMGLIAGSIMLGTEYMTGSQFIPKMAGKKGYSETTAKLTNYFISKAEKEGIKVTEMITKNPAAFKDMIFKAHKWLEGSASSRASAFAKGFTGEAIQETSEDFGFALTKEGYDLISGKKAFDQDWENVAHDLLGSFLVGGFSGGLTRFAMYKKNAVEEDLVDEKRNNFITNEIAQGNGSNLLLAIEDAFMKEELGSKVLSANRDEKGAKILASKDKNINAKSENEFFRDVFKSQVMFAMQVHADLRGKVGSKQEMADTMFQLMGQKAFDGELKMDDLVKGVSQAIEIEAMQIFRKESITRGRIALSIAKKKSVSSDSLINTLTDVRIVNGKTVAVKRSGEIEFSNPSIEERTAIDMSFAEFNNNTASGFKDKFNKSSKDLAKAVIAKKNLESFVGKFSESVKLTEFAQKKMVDLEEAIKDENKISDDFEKLMTTEGYDISLIENAVELQFIEQFKEQLTNGERALRYGKNYRLNMQKKNVVDIFKGKEDYNVEDFKSEKNGYEYFAETSSDSIKETNETSDNYDKEIKELIKLGDTVNAIALTKIALEENMRFSTDGILALNEYFKQFADSFTAETSIEYESDLKEVAAIVKFVTEGQVNSSTLTQLGLEDLIDSVKEEEIEKLMAGLTQQDLETIVNSIEKEHIGDGSEFTQDEFDRILNEVVPRLISMKSKFDSLNQALDVITKVNDKSVVVGKLASIDSLEGFLQNQNMKMNYNYSDTDSIGAVLNSKTKSFEKDKKGFIDNGTLNSLVNEIRKNQRYIIGRIIELTNNDLDSKELVQGEMQKLEDGMNRLYGQLSLIEILQQASNRNRGDRFKRDYEVKSDYISNATTILSQIDKILNIGNNTEILALDKILEINDENKLIIDQDFERLIEFEEEYSKIITDLNDAQASDLIQEMIVKKGPEDLYYYLFKSFNEDQKNPFNPTSERDILEAKFNYLTMLSRGNIRDYFTFSNEYIKARELKEDFIPSQEQILIAKHVFSVINADKLTAVERQFKKVFEEEGYDYERNLVFLRGVAGAGKTSMTLNLAVETSVLRKKALTDRKTNILFTAPIEAQIQNLEKSFTEVKSEDLIANRFDLTSMKGVNEDDFLKGKNIIVVDEATVFTLQIQLLIKKVNEHNMTASVPVKIIMIGDELQKSGEQTPEPTIYGKQNKIIFERSVPLTTPYRSGKVDSFDINGNHREVIAELAKMYITTKRKSEYTMPTGEKINLDEAPDQERIEAIRSVIKSIIKPKSTSYTEKNGAINYGVRAYSSAIEVNEKFVKDYIAKEIKEGMVLITDNYEFTVNQLKDLFKQSGFDLTDSKIETLVFKSEKTQGLTFDHVYTNIEIGEHEYVSDYMKDFESLYVAESREKRSLVLVSPMGTIDSKKVVNESTIPSFSELNLKEKNGEELIGDSLELYLNNIRISKVIESLSGDISTRTGQEITANNVDTSPEAVEDVNQNNDSQPTPESNEEPENNITDPKPKEKMIEEKKKQADESIAENDERKNQILDDLDKMTTEEILSDDIDIMDMFKGCKI